MGRHCFGSSTNVFGWEFPLEFYLALDRPPIGEDSRETQPGGWELDFIAKGSVTAIGEGRKPEIPSEVGAALDAPSSRRFRPEPPAIHLGRLQTQSPS